MNYTPHEFANIFPMMTAEEHAGLVGSMRQQGFDNRYPVILYGGKILDGRNRYKAALECGIDPSIDTFVGNDNAALQFVISSNLHRRHLNETQRARVAGKLANMEHGGYRGRQDRNSDLEITLPQAAAMLNVSRDTVQKAKAAETKAPETGALMDSGKLSAESAKKISVMPASQRAAVIAKVESGEKASDAIREVKREEIIAKLENIETKEQKALAGKYDVIVIDPPWPMEKIERDVAPNQVKFDYPVMQEEELAMLEMPAADDCHMWLWTTHKFLPMALRLLDNWQFKYVCTFVWHKPGGFQPFGLPQYNCEFAIYARRGNPQFIDTKAFNTCFNAQRGAHSEKPEEFYDVVRRVTAGRRIDIFNRRAIEGFDVWGNES